MHTKLLTNYTKYINFTFDEGFRCAHVINSLSVDTKLSRQQSEKTTIDKHIPEITFISSAEHNKQRLALIGFEFNLDHVYAYSIQHILVNDFLVLIRENME